MSSIACVAVPRFSLVAACGQERVAEEALALTSGRGSNARVVEVSRRAEEAGVRRGMRMAAALGRAPGLLLALPDPAGADDLWERSLRHLESIGAEVESERPGEAYFHADGLRGLYGGTVAGVLDAAEAAVPLRARTAAAPSRFSAFLVAVGERRALGLGRSGARVLDEGGLEGFLSRASIGSLLIGPGLREEVAVQLVETLERVGVTTLGGLAALGADHVADRLGRAGLRALELATGMDRRLRPRTPAEDLREDLDLPDGAGSGAQLEAGLRLAVARLLERPQRKGRTILAVRLSVRLDGGGSWTTSQTLGTATGSARTISSLLLRRLEALPSTPTTAFGPPPADQLSFPEADPFRDEARLDERIRQLRSLQGADVVLGIVDVEPGSRVPERRAALVPYSRRRSRSDEVGR
jgi:protein ImuB